MRRLRILLIFTCIQLVSTGAANGTCADSGLKAYRSKGPAAAAQEFGRALERPECRQDQITLLNYARSIEAISIKEKNAPLACEGAELLLRVKTDRTTAVEIAKMASAGADRLSLSCTVLAANTDVSYRALLMRAQSAQKAKRTFHSRLALDAAVRLAPERLPAHRILCRILKQGDIQAAQGHCKRLKALSMRRATPAADDKVAWVWTGLSASLLGAGLTAYFLARAAADEAFDWNHTARQAAERRDYADYVSANERQAASIDQAQQLQITGWALLGAGVITAGWATYYWLDDKAAKIDIGPNYVSFGVKF